MVDEKKDNSWYDIWQNWMSPEDKNLEEAQGGDKDKKIDEWYELWSSWMAPDAIDYKKKDEKE